MFPIFQKTVSLLRSEREILENFIQQYGEELSGKVSEFKQIPHIRDGKSRPFPTLMFAVNKEEVRNLRQEIWEKCEKVLHEEGLWYMGMLDFAGRRIGFYLGMSYELEHEWARFWLE